MNILNADELLRREIGNLSQYITRFRLEIARINFGDPNTRFKNMADHLDAIIEQTDAATHSILHSLEEITAIADKLQTVTKDPETAGICDQLIHRTTDAMEACTFQDITGQRVSKIVRSMKFVEERVNAMVELMGREGIMAAVDELGGDQVMKDENQHYLQGPQLPGESISQDDIDKLFA
jgi:chemotaxis protein CheZ